jgi:hypothetical protein
MAQTSDGISAVGGKVEISTNNSDWTDISGYAAGITFSGYDRQSGEAFTFDGDEAIVGFGKLNPTEVEVRCVYTNGSTDPYKTVLGQHQTAGGGALYVRWSPEGGDTTGEDIFTSKETSKCIGILPPDGEAGPGDPVMFAFKVKTPGWSQTDAA